CEPNVPFGSDLLCRHSMSKNRDIAAVLMNQTHHDADGRGFSGTIRPDESHDLSLRNLQVDVVEREEWILLSHAFELYSEIRHLRSFAAMLSEASRSRSSSSSGRIPRTAESRIACSKCFRSSCS